MGRHALLAVGRVLVCIDWSEMFGVGVVRGSRMINEYRIGMKFHRSCCCTLLALRYLIAAKFCFVIDSFSRQAYMARVAPFPHHSTRGPIS